MTGTSRGNESGGSAVDSLSQLAARILNQLSLSAWLPAAALTLLVTFVFELAAGLSGRGRATNPGDALARTFTALGKTSVGGLFLLVIVIVVTTMLTQAFSFEAIRVLEGYWGTTWQLEELATRKCARQRSKHERLKDLYGYYLTLAAERVTQMAKEERDGRRRVFGKTTLSALADVAMGNEPSAALTAEQRQLVDDYWAEHADADLLRRHLNVDKKMDDYPDDAQHIMPTRLGNVLRRHEDEATELAGVAQIETFVDKIFASLPFTMQVSHDEQRSRLDLYCSMVFVQLLAALIAIFRFGYEHWNYGASAVGIAAIGSWVSYRAAIASARYYGSLLVTIADYIARAHPEDVQLAAVAGSA
jgi:hypothetical protein